MINKTETESQKTWEEMSKEHNMSVKAWMEKTHHDNK